MKLVNETNNETGCFNETSFDFRAYFHGSSGSPIIARRVQT